jgi:hypothetical protein
MLVMIDTATLPPVQTQIPTLEDEERDCDMSPCGQYRYLLQIVWDRTKPLVGWIGLNPSIADKYRDDPTIRRIKNFSKAWGYGGIMMTNLFAYRATDPREMKRHPQPIAEPDYSGLMNANDNALLKVYEQCGEVVACWGNNGSHQRRSTYVKQLLPGLKALRMTSKGEPWHPLYLPDETTLIDLI